MRSDAAECAKIIKQQLKIAFPGVRFSVLSRIFSNGNSVHITWTPGPSRLAVWAVAEEYKAGYFDAMTDSYIYKQRRDTIPRVMFIHLRTQRTDEN